MYILKYTIYSAIKQPLLEQVKKVYYMARNLGDIWTEEHKVTEPTCRGPMFLMNLCVKKIRRNVSNTKVHNIRSSGGWKHKMQRKGIWYFIIVKLFNAKEHIGTSLKRLNTLSMSIFSYMNTELAFIFEYNFYTT